eukprot:CAMPEP_0174837900 /NCGR_PEP_ID=MMETSP1114-20130205/7065_1 /TAXON_ID=312471 /ORGANISM="Neobodo designis, Strain CCAP 1951/1" /LENGTH=66 /DNA_ID=CAMNT_0016071987 /DNA_START=88 /DNA_END=284 /DNA_ORIENTATION=-
MKSGGGAGAEVVGNRPTGSTCDCGVAPCAGLAKELHGDESSDVLTRRCDGSCPELVASVHGSCFGT